MSVITRAQGATMARAELDHDEEQQLVEVVTDRLNDLTPLPDGETDNMIDALRIMLDVENTDRTTALWALIHRIALHPKEVTLSDHRIPDNSNLAAITYILKRLEDQTPLTATEVHQFEISLPLLKTDDPLREQTLQGLAFLIATHPKEGQEE